MEQIAKYVLLVSFSVGAMVSTYATADFANTEIEASENIEPLSISEKSSAWDKSRYVPVYGHIPHWGKRISKWMFSND